MAFSRLEPFADIGLNEALLEFLIDEHETTALPEYDRLWKYYRNPGVPMERIDRGARRTVWRPAQAEALPARLTEPNAFGMTKEIVVENEIGWRIETLADYLAAGGVRLISRSDSNHERRDRLEDTAHTIIESNGGSLLIQEMAILGSIYGHVDLLIRRDGAAAHGGSSSLTSAAHSICIELIEAPRAIPILDPDDYAHLLGYIIRYRKFDNQVIQPGFLERAARKAGLLKSLPAQERAAVDVTEILSPARHQVYEDHDLVVDETNAYGLLPIVHIQNLPQPYFYEGLSDVEPSRRSITTVRYRRASMSDKL